MTKYEVEQYETYDNEDGDDADDDIGGYVEYDDDDYYMYDDILIRKKYVAPNIRIVIMTMTTMTTMTMITMITMITGVKVHSGEKFTFPAAGGKF